MADPIRPMSVPVPIGIVGVGKIARDAHVPSIAADPRFRIAATVTLGPGIDGIPGFATIAAMARAVPDVRAVAICTPPIGRLALVEEALAHGLDILIEKPPARGIGEAEAIAAAVPADRVLFTAWHSRFAPAVEPLAAWLATRRLRQIDVVWKEDVRVWHPGQEWIWEPGIGVFDPGINALSILTRLIPDLSVTRATLHVPANRAAPIAADLTLTDRAGTPVVMALDSDQRGPQTWAMTLTTDTGVARLTDGGAALTIDGAAVALVERSEYAGIYDHFARCLTERRQDIDLSPFRLVADAFMIGRHIAAPAFSWTD